MKCMWASAIVCCTIFLLQEPSFVVVGHDPTSGEVHHYTYPANQSAFLPQVMSASSDMPPAQQTSAAGAPSQPPACLPTSVPSAATIGAGDGSGNMMPQDPLLVSSHHNVPDPRLQGSWWAYIAVVWICSWIWIIIGKPPTGSITPMWRNGSYWFWSVFIRDLKVVTVALSTVSAWRLFQDGIVATPIQ